jgi:hypothetical protein
MRRLMEPHSVRLPGVPFLSSRSPSKAPFAPLRTAYADRAAHAMQTTMISASITAYLLRRRLAEQELMIRPVVLADTPALVALSGTTGRWRRCNAARVKEGQQ